MFLEIFPILLGCPNCWNIMACYSLMIFCISVILVVISSLFFFYCWDFFFIIESSLFFSSLAWIKVYQFCLLKKKKFLILLIFSIFFLILFFSLWFYDNIFLILLTLGFICYFSTFFTWSVWLFKILVICYLR